MLLAMDLNVLALVLAWDDDIDDRSGDMDGEVKNLGGKWMDLGEGVSLRNEG